MHGKELRLVKVSCGFFRAETIPDADVRSFGVGSRVLGLRSWVEELGAGLGFSDWGIGFGISPTRSPS